MAECSVLAASSKARMSSCSASLSRWDSPITASLCGLVRGHDRPGRLDAQTPRGLPVGTPGARHQETRLAAAKRTAGRWPIISSGILSAARPRRSAGRRITSWMATSRRPARPTSWSTTRGQRPTLQPAGTTAGVVGSTMVLMGRLCVLRQLSSAVGWECHTGRRRCTPAGAGGSGHRRAHGPPGQRPRRPASG
jgi:hypothetical protein